MSAYLFDPRQYHAEYSALGVWTFPLFYSLDFPLVRLCVAWLLRCPSCRLSSQLRAFAISSSTH